MTTWSGNGTMMAVAEKLGFLKEGQIRKVRYYQGQYYDKYEVWDFTRRVGYKSVTIKKETNHID